MTDTPYPHLFSPFKIRNLELKNRLVMAPMSTELGGKHGEVTPEMIAFYRERALGGMGLIVVEYTCIAPDTGRAHEYQLTLESRRNLDGHRRLVKTVHDAGAKILMQMQHSGQYSNPAVLPDNMPAGPCDVFHRKDPTRKTSRALTGAEIEDMVEYHGRTAGLAIEAGYDGVELHGAHGYLLLQFMSPLSNHRDDEWGGDFERRLAFPLAVIRRIRKEIGDKALVYRISADEFRPGGLTIDDMEVISQRLVEAGADAIHVSMGWGVGKAIQTVLEPMSTEEGWRIPYARRIREATGVPVIAVGQIRWPETGEKAVANDDADLIALGRPMLADPYWANKAREGRRDQIRPCTSCNWCLTPKPGRHQVGCAENPRAGSEMDAPLLPNIGKGRKAVVVGAGPGGLSAALMLDQNGFETHLYESRDFLGGGIIASATPPGKDKLFWYRDYLETRLKGSNVKVHLKSAATADVIETMAPDVTLIAAGTKHRGMDIPGIKSDMVIDAYDVLMGEADAVLAKGQTAVVYGGGETGCEMAEYLAERHVHVTLVSRSPASKLARAAENIYRGALLERLHANALITVVDNTHVTKIGNGKVTIETRVNDKSETRELDADRLFMAQGRDAQPDLADELDRRGLVYELVGDANDVGRIGDAVHSAYRAVLALSAQYGPSTMAAC